MALNFKVQGLGRIEDANINVSPLTVITGPNGTGKSFFTKMAYSIFRVIEEASSLDLISFYSREYLDNTSEHLEGLIQSNEHLQHTFFSKISENLVKTTNDEIEKIINLIDQTSISSEERSLNEILKIINHIRELIKDNMNIDIFEERKEIKDKFELSIEKSLRQLKLEENLVDLASKTLFVCLSGLNLIYILALNNKTALEISLNNALKNELINNFQVEDISDLKNTQKRLIFSCENLFSISLEDGRTSVDVTGDVKSLNFFRAKPKSNFFESPAYWRVRDALINANRKSGENFLSGVPKYFFDLDSDLRKKSKKESELLHVHESIKSELSGEFIFEGGDISFHDETLGKEISKNLVSFGMTNLGMLNSLIKNNVIKKGSYVFIDEPETNLHPDWQVLMIQSLVALSRAGVNVIITTHSTEILKYIEVSFSKVKEEESAEKVKELLSVNYLDTDGTSLEFDSKCPIEQTKEALLELSSPFLTLYMEGM